MPRAKTVTMGKVSPQESYEAGLKKAIKLYSPHAVVDGELVNSSKAYAVVYTAPRGGEREIVMVTDKHSAATRLRDRLNRAWAKGFYVSGRV